MTEQAAAQVLRAAEYAEICERVAAEELSERGDLYYVACDPYVLPLPAPVLYTRTPAPAAMPRMSMPEMHIAKLDGALVCPGQVLVHADGTSLLVDSFRRNARKNNSLVELGPNLYGSPTELRPQQILPGRHFYLDGRHGRHFGHFLTEVLPRLWAAEFLDLDDTRLLIDRRQFRPWMLEHLRPFGFGPDQVTLFDGPVQCQELVVARQACVLGRYFHPLVQPLARRIAAFHGGPRGGPGGGPTHVYLSRRGVQQRRLVNEERIEEIARRAGFTPVRPETLPVGEQIRLFAGATHLVWPIGSNGYNALFATQGPRKLVLRSASFRNQVDVTLNAAIGGEISFVEGEQTDPAENPMTGSWQLDPDFFAESLADWLSRG